MSKQYKTITDIKDAVSDARYVAEREARRGGSAFVRSRGACLNTINIHQGQCSPNPAAEDEQWKGTNKQLDALIDEVQGMDVDEIWISGGFDGAECPRYMNEGDYDPWVSSWDILVWKRT